MAWRGCLKGEGWKGEKKKMLVIPIVLMEWLDGQAERT